jgi:hypothetical protein
VSAKEAKAEATALDGALLVTVFPALIVVRGFLLCVLWGWFFVPALHAPPLSWGAAQGISLTASMMLGSGSSSDNEGKTFAQIMFGSVLKLAFVFGIGWALHFAV